MVPKLEYINYIIISVLLIAGTTHKWKHSILNVMWPSLSIFIIGVFIVRVLYQEAISNLFICSAIILIDAIITTINVFVKLQKAYPA